MKKNKIWKRAGAVILSTALLFGTLPTGVMAEETVGHDTNEEELLSEEVVSEDEPAEEILPEEVSSEEEVDPDTAEAESEVSESTGETGESESDSQYHFTEGDVASILTWKKQYFSEGYEQLLAQDESWWDGLYDYERDLAEFLVSIAPDVSEQVYLGQDLEQCLEILDTGVSANEFFLGTIFEGLERIRAARHCLWSRWWHGLLPCSISVPRRPQTRWLPMCGTIINRQGTDRRRITFIIRIIRMLRLLV